MYCWCGNWEGKQKLTQVLTGKNLHFILLKNVLACLEPEALLYRHANYLGVTVCVGLLMPASPLGEQTDSFVFVLGFFPLPSPCHSGW